MSKQNKARIKQLEQLIVRHKSLYYQGSPEISDDEFDALEDELRSLDKDNYVLNIVGSEVKGSKKIPHQRKMLSLGKSYELKELFSWVGKHHVVSTFKVDGVSCSLIYEDGILTMAKTRGDGSFGEDITKKVMWIPTVPKKLVSDFSGEIRGELLCDEKSFFHLSEEMVSLKLERPASQRNIVAGLVGRKENLALCRYLHFLAFECYPSEDEGPHKLFSTEWEKFSLLEKFEFDLPVVALHKDKSSIESYLEKVKHFITHGDYQIDGAVFTYNQISLHDELGETAHHPRYKMAFKFRGESKDTEINEIHWQVSRNGVLTPVAEVKVIELSGAKISKVTLHNYGVVKQHQLKKGDRIKIMRSGEVIPKFLEVVKSSSKDKFQIPEQCPSCGGTVVEKEIRLICQNKSCYGRQKDSILNFIQKIGIDDLSSKRLDEMIKLGLVEDISSLYDLTIEGLMSIDKVKEKLATKLYQSIQSTKDTDLKTFLSALGISGGAYNKCEKIVDSGLNTLDKIREMKVDDLVAVESFAEKSASDFISSLKDKSSLIDSLIKKGVKVRSAAKNSAGENSEITGKKFCITGALSVKRSDIEGKIKNFGGVVQSGVSKNTDFLVTNETTSSSSKFVKAQKLGVSVISEKELFQLLEK